MTRQLEIYYDDLKLPVQLEVLELLGIPPKKENWDVFPLTIIVQEDDSGNEITSNVSQQTPFQITSVCKEDILHAFKESELLDKVKQCLDRMDESEMRELASKMADAYCEQLFWESLRIIFEDIFLNQEVVIYDGSN